ncbi:MAG: hypothetical protein U0230_08615 [Polyangiales bacterium]
MATELGEEGRDLALLVGATIPLVPGYLLRLASDGREHEVRRAVAELVSRHGAVRLRPLCATQGIASRLAELLPPLDDVTSADDPALGTFLEAFAGEALRSALSGRAAGLPLRVLACDAASGGLATSTDPANGDPDVLGVLPLGASRPWRIDRRSGRVVEVGDGMEARVAEQVADLVDRVQLALRRPVRIDWATHGGRPAVAGVRPERLELRFVSGHYRRVALVAADEGTVAPLAVDALDRGLSTGARVPGSTVKRIYARPYRRLDVPGKLLGGEVGPLPTAARTAGRVAFEAARAIAADQELLRRLPGKLTELGAVDLRSLHDDSLLAALDARHAVVAEAFGRLDECRESTRRVVVALEESVGPLPREVYPALSTPKNTRQRLRALSELSDLARRASPYLGASDVRAALPVPIARKWDAVRKDLADLRPLGIDIVPDCFGSSDESLARALRSSPRRRADALEQARWEAMRHVLAMARRHPMSAARAGIASSLGVALDRIVASKGKLAEALAVSMRLLRDAALEVGRRLVDAAVLDAAEDAFYLTQGELVEALSGEPGAYAARVRVRREDDARWALFDAPRRLDS